MKIVILESQYKRLIETEEKQKVLHIPSLQVFSDDIFQAWNILQKFLERKGNPPYSIGGDLNLSYYTSIESLGNLVRVDGELNLKGSKIKSLGNLVSVGGDLRFYKSNIKSLENLQSVGGCLNLIGTPIKSLGNLQSVGEYLDLSGTPIKSLGNLQSVGEYLDLIKTPLSKMYTEKQIREMVNVEGKIYLST